MLLNPKHIAKIDPLLEEALTQVQKDEVIRASVILDAAEVKASPVLSPSQFSSRQAYRQALVEQRRQQMSEALGDTLESLRKLSLKTLGDTISPVVVVEGTADQILRALELPDVRHASLDRLVGVPDRVFAAQVDYIANLYSQTLGDDLDEKTRETITQAAEQYILNYYREYGNLQVLGMPKPVKLESVFTGVYCLELKPPACWWLEPEEKRQQVFRQGIEQGFEIRNEKRLNGIVAANQNSYLMVLGAPGSGKSTLLRKIGLEAFKGRQGSFHHECLPVLIELKILTNEDINIEQKIAEKLSNCRLPLVEKFTTQGLIKGKLLILLDGLDEVPTKNQDLAIRQIESLLERYPENRFICSCRKAAYRRPFLKFKNAEIASFEDEQIRQFIQKWFHSEADKQAKTAERCWELLNTENHQATKELAKTPLLLTFICLLYDRSQDFPIKRSTLYTKALDILLERWWSERRVLIDPIYRHLGVDLEKRMLSEIAYTSFATGKLLERQQLEKQIQNFLENNENAPKALNAGAIIDAIAIQQGILVEQTKDVFSFSHLTIQEYLAAQYIVDRRQIEQLVANHITDKRWKEVFLLVAGLMPDHADELLLLIEKETQKYLNTDVGQKYLVPLLKWVERVTTGSRSNLESINKRCLAIVFASANAYAYSYADAFSRAIPAAFRLAYPPVHALSYVFSLANVYALAGSFAPKDLVNTYSNAYRLLYAYALAKSYPHTCAFRNPNPNEYHNALSEFITYARQLQQAAIFNNEINISALVARLEKLRTRLEKLRKSLPGVEEKSYDYQNFSNVIIKVWLDAFNLDAEFIKLSKKNLEQIDQQYSYLNLLMVQCKQDAVNVSKETWKAIESRMFVQSKSEKTGDNLSK